MFFLDELEVRVCMPFHAAFDEYAAKVPSIFNSTNTKSAHVQFRDLVLQERWAASDYYSGRKFHECYVNGETS